MDIIHLNASMMTKKSQVEENVINASKYSIMSSSRYKTIILDESERLSSYSQDSLKSWLETKNKRVIVIFIVNDLSKMIDAIRSRCLVLNFVSPTKEEIKENLYRIIEEEDVEIDDHTLNEILKESRGDVRKSVVLLQQFMNGGSFEKKSLNLLDFFKLIVSKEIIKAYEFLYDLFSENRPSYVIDQLFEYFLEKKKPKFVLYLANLEDSINRGGNMRIAIMKFCVMMSNGK
jgi:DNA polymerase III delta prime subunit